MKDLKWKWVNDVFICAYSWTKWNNLFTIMLAACKETEAHARIHSEMVRERETQTQSWLSNSRALIDIQCQPILNLFIWHQLPHLKVYFVLKFNVCEWVGVSFSITSTHCKTQIFFSLAFCNCNNRNAISWAALELRARKHQISSEKSINLPSNAAPPPSPPTSTTTTMNALVECCENDQM